MRNRAFLYPALLSLALSASAYGTFDPSLDDEEAATPAPAPAPAPVQPAPAPAPAPAPVPAPAPHVESGPRDLNSYLSAGKTPKYIRIDINGYHYRTTADFNVRRSDNVDPRKSTAGDLFAVKDVKKMNYGAAVQIQAGENLRWVYVPNGDKTNFQFCESEACFSAMASSLDFLLKGTGVSYDDAKSCGVSAGPEGLILPPGAAQPKHEDPLEPVSAKVPPLPPKKPPVEQTPEPKGGLQMSVKPLWETAKGAVGAQWTQMLSDSLDKWGKGLLAQKNIADAKYFCPNFSRLSTDQKKEFYVHLLAGIARSESSFKTTTPAFDEIRKRDVFRGPIQPRNYSMGLFQLSYSSAPGYRPGCRIDYDKDKGKDISNPSLTIYDVKIQMDCAVTVMNQWIPRDGAIGLSSTRGGARFWSTLRSSNPATRDVIASVKRDTACWK